ncbi:MAG: hypothetical protein ACYC65_07355 [Candidatus Limnocylindrales bacterium]
MALRKFATLGGVSIAGLALIGAGAAATFTQTTQSYQQVQAGTMDVTLSGDGALSNSDHTLTFAAFGPTNSSFTTGDNLVTIKNSGNITVQEITEQIGATGDGALISQLYACEVSWDSGSGIYRVIYNGPLSGGLGLQAIAGSLAPGATDTYKINVYAGSTVNTACGAVTGIGAAAPAAPAPNPAAISLDNLAQGLSATVSVTVGYSS